MKDNVVKFRRIEKKPEQPPRKRREPPAWLPFALLIVVALAIYGVQRSGILGG
ncbi:MULTISPECIES: hypothetical protein [unclassified Devosia]|uniref:hypothetical protein n=1 Tax=unclassified Devosia TaxID=196773 RepID=UPI0013E384EC|nr:MULTISPECIES: hypothetical protein [unclassified Devosia]